MRRVWRLTLLLAMALPLAAQEGGASVADDPVVVSAEHPRLFLRPSRLRLLRRERERQSMRWQQFEALISGNAPMPEPGFAHALYYQVAGDAAAGRRAIAWALGPGTDLRQLSLVYDWCQALLTDAQRRDLGARMTRRMSETAADDSIPAVRARGLAAIVLFDEVPQAPQRELDRIVHTWWPTKIDKQLKAGHNVIPRDDTYALMELLHGLADTTHLDLRESAPAFFKDFPIEHLMTYYPAPFPAAENDYYVGTMKKPGEPNLQAAALSRAAELAMVAYDVNAPATQVLQGWLMHDRFMLRGTFGSPYEFLWANPYQPGLSYYHVPLVYYNPDFGRLFVRSSWEDTAEWFGLFDGMTQMFTDGHLTILNPQLTSEPLSFKEATICFGHTARKFQFTLEEEQQALFIVALAPRHAYTVEVDDEEMFEATTDLAGTLELDDIPRGKPIGVRLGEVSR